MVIELPKTTNARMGNAGSSRQSTLHQRFKQYPVDSMKMPMPEQNELEKRFTKVLVCKSLFLTTIFYKHLAQEHVKIHLKDMNVI
ncbi:formin-like protein CG32138 [Trichonephila clavipes]|nr:formin-like protein CG32138 [Trichonephila clavipes]